MADQVIEEWSYYNAIIERRAVKRKRAAEGPDHSPPKPPPAASADDEAIHIVVPLHTRTGPGVAPGPIIDHAPFDGPPVPHRREAGPVIDHPPLDRTPSSSTSVIPRGAPPGFSTASGGGPRRHEFRPGVGTPSGGSPPSPPRPPGAQQPPGAQPPPRTPPGGAPPPGVIPPPGAQASGAAPTTPHPGAAPAATPVAAPGVQPIKHRDWTWLWVILIILLLFGLYRWWWPYFVAPHPSVTYAPPAPVATTVPPASTAPIRPPPSPTTGSEAAVTNFTQFQTVRFRSGEVVTGWNFHRNGDAYPYNQYCYYTAPEEEPGETLLGPPVAVPSSPGSVMIKYDIEDRPGSVKPLPDKLRSSLGQQGWNEARSKCIWHD